MLREPIPSSPSCLDTTVAARLDGGLTQPTSGSFWSDIDIWDHSNALTGA